MSVLKGILDTLKGSFIKEVGSIVDSVTTTDEEKQVLKNKLVALVVNIFTTVLQVQAQVLTTEMTGSKLQRNWRPIVMLSFAAVVVYSKFLAPAFSLDNTDLEPGFWNLLELGIGGYVIGRTAEKVISNVSKNVDLPFLKKKDRKEAIVKD